MRELKERHASAYISKIILAVLKEYQVNLNQVLSITTDNGANMLKAVSLLEEQQRDIISDEEENKEQENEEKENEILENEEQENGINTFITKLDASIGDIATNSGCSPILRSVRCAAHTLQLAVDDVLKLKGDCIPPIIGRARKMQTIFYHNNSGQDAFTGDLKRKEVHRAITLHPIKQPNYMYRLHKYIKGLNIQSDNQESINLHRDIAVSMKELGYRKDRLESAELVKNLPLFPSPRGSDDYLGDTNLLGTPTSLNKYVAHELKDVLEWELISKTLYSHSDENPRRRIGSSLKEGLGDVVREIMDIINSYSKQRGRVIDFKEILYGYWRHNPIHGADLILDLLLVYKKYRGHKMTVQVRRHAYVQQTFSGIFIREVNQTHHESRLSVTESLPLHKKFVNNLFSQIGNISKIFNFVNETKKPVVHFMLPLSGRYKIFRRFMQMYEDVCLKEDEETKLYLILYKDELFPDDFVRTKYLIEQIRRKYPNKDINVLYPSELFARGKALQHGVNTLKDEDLMLFIDVDMIFDKTTLERIRRNTMRNKSIYFPIVYSLYDPVLLNASYVNMDYDKFTPNMVNERNGFWRHFGFGIVSLYKSDYLKVGGFNLLISGWGNEDVTFFDNVIKSNLTIVRSADPSLIHVFHAIYCSNDLSPEQMNMCLGSKANTLGSLPTLQDYFLKYKHIIFR